MLKTAEQIYNLYKEGKLNEKLAYRLSVFVEDLEGFEKDARFPGSIADKALQALAFGGAVSAGNALVNKAIEQSSEKKMDQATSDGFERMMMTNPKLREYDINLVRDIYSTLARFAPSIATDPHAASGYVNRVLQFDPESGADFNVIRTLTSLEKDHQQTKKMRTERPLGTSDQLFKTVGNTAIQQGMG